MYQEVNEKKGEEMGIEISTLNRWVYKGKQLHH